MEGDARRQLSSVFLDSRHQSHTGCEDRRDALQGWEGAPPDSSAKHMSWRSSFSKKAFLATILTVACMMVFRTKEAVWCWSNECGYGGFRGLDFSVMQKMVDMSAGLKLPRSDFSLKVEEDSTLGAVLVSRVNRSQAGAFAPIQHSQVPVGTSFSSEVTSNFGCKGKADCPAEKLCVLKACMCPVLYSGDHQCESPTPGLAAGCITPITSPRLQLFAKTRNISLPVQGFSVKNNTVGDSGNTTLTKIKQELWSNIQDLADFSTCAVVGSSSSMLSKGPGQSFGEEIDDHSAVIRFNDAPTHGFEEWVGSKTTLRIQNVIYCGFREEPGEFCFRYSSKERKNGHIDMKAKNPLHCRPVNATSEMLMYAMAYWQLSSVIVEHDTYNQPALPWEKSLRKMSAGFFGVALAAHVCGKVDVYGFDSGEQHYYIKSPNLKHKAKSQCTLAGCKSKHSFSQRHSWRQESKCLAHILGGGLPRLQIRTRPQQLD